MMQSFEEKFELDVSIPRKLYDECEHNIKIKIKVYECQALCDFGASISTIPKTLCDVLGFREFDDCSLNLHLADSAIKKPIRCHPDVSCAERGAGLGCGLRNFRGEAHIYR